MIQASDVIWNGVREDVNRVSVPISWDVEDPPGSWWLTVKVMQGTRGALTPEAGAAQVAQLIKRRASYNFCVALAKELGGVSDG